MKEDRNDAYRQWRSDPQGFWRGAAQDIHWVKPFDAVCDVSQPPFTRWFPDGLLNACYNAVDIHVERGFGARPALIYDSPLAGRQQILTYAELQIAVARLAGALTAREVRAGDRVVIYMPMVPQAVMAMLACARIGAIHSFVFGGFAARELAARIDHAMPKLVLTASCGLEPGRLVDYKQLLDMALELATHKPAACLILQRPEQPATLIAGRDVDWNDAVHDSTSVDCVPVPSTHPAYILYTSGTTGSPKGVVRDTGGHLVALKWSMTHIYGMQPDETFWAASDLGWVVGHSYIVYGPLLQGCATLLYEGKPVGTPDAGAFWRVIQDHRVRTLFAAPTALRAIKREDPEATLLRRYDTSSLRALFLAGERADSDTIHWAGQHLKVPVIDHWWQTESGWPIAASCARLGPPATKPGSAGKAMPGFDVRIMDSSGQEAPSGTSGSIVVQLPLPPGCLATLWNNDAGFVESYLSDYPGFYRSGDAGYLDAEGYLYVLGRTDDIINVAGHRLSTGEMEQVLSSHADVAECAVIGVADALKGALPLGLVVLKAGVTSAAAEVTAELIARMREQLGPVASFRKCLIVKRLPKTRSGKILRATMRQIANGQPYNVPATIEDPLVLEEIEAALTSASSV